MAHSVTSRPLPEPKGCVLHVNACERVWPDVDRSWQTESVGYSVTYTYAEHSAMSLGDDDASHAPTSTTSHSIAPHALSNSRTHNKQPLPCVESLRPLQPEAGQVRRSHGWAAL